MLLLNIEYVPGKEIEALGLVKGTVVQSKNFGKDFMAGMKTLVGGEITGYTEMLIEARQIATKRMVDAAEELGADAVVGLRYASVMLGLKTKQEADFAPAVLRGIRRLRGKDADGASEGDLDREDPSAVEPPHGGGEGSRSR